MSPTKDPDLPLDVVQRASPPVGRARWTFRRRYLLVLLIPALMFTGAVMGMYFQPLALQKFYALTGLQPGAGSTAPIALPPEIVLPQEMVVTMQASDVVGLARLLPRGDVSIVAPPYGAGDARIAEITVTIGDRVEQGAVVARLDNQGQLENAVLLAQANVATTQAALDNIAAADRQAALAVQNASATLARFASAAVDAQPDVIVARRNLDAALHERAARHVLGLVGLADSLQYLPGNLSGGQKQRVAVAWALVGNPDVVFADEPTAALDRESGMVLVEMLKKLGAARGTTTVMVTHDNRILELADRIVTLEDGRIVADTAPL